MFVDCDLVTFTLEGAVRTDHQHSQNKYLITSFQSAAIKTLCWQTAFSACGICSPSEAAFCDVLAASGLLWENCRART